MSNVDASGDCWRWIGVTNGGGYGTFQDGSAKGIGAHVWMHREMTGESPEVVRHTCRNPSCVKPTHLAPGTQKLNMQDKFYDRSGNTQKLSPEDIQSIRKRFVRTSPRKSNAKELATEYGVQSRYICRIADGRSLSYVR